MVLQSLPCPTQPIIHNSYVGERTRRNPTYWEQRNDQFFYIYEHTMKNQQANQENHHYEKDKEKQQKKLTLKEANITHKITFF